MAYKAKIQNTWGEVLQLNDQEDRWVVESITGLNPSQTILSLAPIYGMDGSRLNNAKLDTRNIVILLAIRGDCDANREALYQFFPQKMPVRFIYETSRREVYVDGYVEMIDFDSFQRVELMQISIICPDPYFRDLTETVVKLENLQGGFEFPFSINIGDPVELGTIVASRETEVIIDSQTETPFEIEITARKQLYYFTSFTIQNVLTGEKIGFTGWPNDDGFCVGDVIRISTDPYHPTMTLQIGDATYNRIPQMIQGGTFFTLHPGRNLFAYKTSTEPGDADFLDISLKFRKLYRGV